MKKEICKICYYLRNKVKFWTKRKKRKRSKDEEKSIIDEGNFLAFFFAIKSLERFWSSFLLLLMLFSLNFQKNYEAIFFWLTFSLLTKSCFRSSTSFFTLFFKYYICFEFFSFWKEENEWKGNILIGAVECGWPLSAEIYLLLQILLFLSFLSFFIYNCWKKNFFNIFQEKFVCFILLNFSKSKFCWTH